MKRDFSYDEIDSLVNAFSEEEFSMLKEAINERNLEEYGVGIGEIDLDNRVVDTSKNKNLEEKSTTSFMPSAPKIFYIRSNGRIGKR